MIPYRPGSRSNSARRPPGDAICANRPGSWHPPASRRRRSHPRASHRATDRRQGGRRRPQLPNPTLRNSSHLDPGHPDPRRPSPDHSRSAIMSAGIRRPAGSAAESCGCTPVTWSAAAMFITPVRMIRTTRSRATGPTTSPCTRLGRCGICAGKRNRHPDMEAARTGSAHGLAILHHRSREASDR